jgi:predicted transcriptional regulator
VLKKNPSSSDSAPRNLGLAIKQRRNEIGITQGDLAVGVGFSAPQTVSDIDAGAVFAALRSLQGHLLITKIDIGRARLYRWTDGPVTEGCQ